LYDRYGNKLSDKPYDFIEYNPKNEILNDRISVGYLTNEEQYLNYLVELYQIDPNDLKKMSAKLENRVAPKLLKGYINTKGEEVIEVKYIEAAPFRHKYTTVTGVDKNGDIYSALIDKQGNTLLNTSYEQMSIFSKDTTLLRVQENGKFGIINLNGEVLLNPEYEKINLTEIPGFFEITVYSQTYLLRENGNKTMVGPEGNLEIRRLEKGYFYTSISGRDDSGQSRTFIHIFNEDGQYVGDYTGYKISKKFLDQQLPNGFIALQKGKNGLPFVLNLQSGMEFRK
jgi:hypothetical protein